MPSTFNANQKKIFSGKLKQFSRGFFSPLWSGCTRWFSVPKYPGIWLIEWPYLSIKHVFELSSYDSQMRDRYTQGGNRKFSLENKESFHQWAVGTSCDKPPIWQGHEFDTLKIKYSMQYEYMMLPMLKYHCIQQHSDEVWGRLAHKSFPWISL